MPKETSTIERRNFHTDLPRNNQVNSDPYFLNHSIVADGIDDINGEYVLLGDGKSLKYVARISSDTGRSGLEDIMTLAKPMPYDTKTEVKVWRFPRRKPPPEKNVIWVTMHYPYISFVTF